MSKTMDAFKPGAVAPGSFDRRSGIGASLAPAVCGLSPFGSPLSAYLYLTGQSDGPEQTEEMAWGNVVEPIIRAHAREHFGCDVAKPMTRRHPDHEWLYASPDGLFDDGWGFDAKNVGPRHARDWKEPETDGVPEYVMVQVQVQAAVFMLPGVRVGACIMGQPPVYYTVPASGDLACRIILGHLHPFWRLVQLRVEPPADWTDPRTPELIEALRRPVAGKWTTLGPEGVALADAYADCGTDKRQAEQAQHEAKGRLIDMMGDAETAVLPDGRTIKRPLIPGKVVTSERKDYHGFFISKARET